MNTWLIAGSIPIIQWRSINPLWYAFRNIWHHRPTYHYSRTLTRLFGSRLSEYEPWQTTELSAFGRTRVGTSPGIVVHVEHNKHHVAPPSLQPVSQQGVRERGPSSTHYIGLFWHYGITTLVTRTRPVCIRAADSWYFQTKQKKCSYLYSFYSWKILWNSFYATMWPWNSNLSPKTLRHQ